VEGIGLEERKKNESVPVKFFGKKGGSGGPGEFGEKGWMGEGIGLERTDLGPWRARLHDESIRTCCRREGLYSSFMARERSRSRVRSVRNRLPVFPVAKCSQTGPCGSAAFFRRA
jgi:hypothetical protein